MARCLRCGLAWRPRSDSPARCPNCKSVRWRDPRPRHSGSGLGISETVGNKREALVRLALRHGLHDVRVFGSVARGDADSKSDLDLLVTVDDSLRGFRAFSSLADFMRDASRLLGRSVDAHTPGSFNRDSAALTEAVAL